MKQYKCRAPGCTKLVDSPGYCQQHQRPIQSATVNKPFVNASRSNQSLYRTYRWRKLKLELLRRQPYCAICGVTVGLQVHHVQPPRGDAGLFYAPENLIVLCEHCHRRLTQRETAARRKQRNIDV